MSDKSKQKYLIDHTSTMEKENNKNVHYIIMKSLDPLRAKKIFIRKKLGHTVVSAIKATSVTLYT